jgi:hypothetical protein
MVEDEKFVTKDMEGNFLNVFIRKAETTGKIGSVEIESSDQLPMTWQQKKDVIMQLIEMNNEGIMAQLFAPENRQILKDAIGLNDFYITGVASREKQLEEIGELIQSAPIPEMQPMMDPNTGIPGMDMMTGMPAMQEVLVPSVPIDPELDDNEIEAEICRSYLISDAGRLLKIENPEGYQNVLLHYKAHIMVIQQQMMMQQQQQMQQEKDGKKPKAEGPMIKEESDVQTS